MKYLTPALAASAILVAFTPAVSGAASSGDADAAARVLQNSRAALGGSALDRAGTLRTEGKVTALGLTGTLRSYSEIGGVRFSEDAITPPIAQGDGYDGSIVWNSDQSGLVWVDGSDAGRSQEIDSAFAADDTLWSANRGGAAVTYDGRETAGGRSYDVLTVTPQNSLVPMHVWIDADTHLPWRYVVQIGPIVSTTTLSDYRSFNGLMVPYRAHNESSDGNSGDEVITSVVSNPAGASDALQKPASDVHDFSMEGGATRTDVPIVLADNHVYLNVMLDGKGPYRFIFDSGGSNLIDPAVAKEIGVTGAGSLQGSGAGSATESFSFAKVDTLKVGDAVLKDQVFAVLPVRQGFGISAGQKVDGLIGFEVLARFVTTFDYAGRTVTFQMPGAAVPAGADVIPFVFSRTQPQFACTIDGISSQCTVDTGARDSITLLSPYIAAHPQVVPQTVSAPGVNGFGVGGGAVGKLGRLASFGMGSFTLPDLVADFSTQQQGFFASPFLAANVGGNVWKRFTVTFDYGKQTMALQPNASLAARDSYERAGMFLINGGGKIVVLDARAGTPAATAGIRKGDAIVAIDGKPAASMTLQQIRDLLSGPTGTVLKIELGAKDGTTRTVSLTLRDWV